MNYNSNKRFLDILLCLICIIFLFLPIIVIIFAVYLSSKRPVLYWSDRVGRNNKIFKMPKFRSMKIGAPVLATHLIDNAQEYLTPIGSFLRRSSLDETPQLWSILIGDMSFVGPRPALFNQHDLIQQRKNMGVHLLLPGLTGLAQISGRDNLSVDEKIKYDIEYLQRKSLLFDMRILFLTIIRVIYLHDIKH